MKSMMVFGVALGAVVFGGCGGGGSSNNNSSGASTSLSTRLGDVVAITRDGKIVTFAAGSPGQLSTSIAISGLQASEVIVGIDTRPSTGEIYGVGSSSHVYRIDASTGVASVIGTNAFTPELRARFIGFDIDPVADVARVSTEGDRNFRLDLRNGAYLGDDTLLAFAASDANFGQNPDVVGLAYTNSSAGAAQTTLYAVDAARDALVRIGDVSGQPSAASSGSLHTIGSLGINAGGNVGFDVTSDGGALLVSTPPSSNTSELYTVDLATGTTRSLGTVGGGSAIRAMAARSAVEPRIVGLTENGDLIAFRPGRPEEVTAQHAVVGLPAGEKLVSIALRTTDARMYGISNAGRLYRVDTSSGAVVAVGSSAISTALVGVEVGFDFNPLFGVGRATTGGDDNLRVNPLDGTLASNDQPLAYDPLDVNNGSNPSVTAIAYTNSALGSTSTTLYGIDSTLDTLVRIGSLNGSPNSPNGGLLSTIGPLGFAANNSMGFDIGPNGAAYAVLNVAGASGLFQIDLTTGAAHAIGQIGGTARIVDLALESTSKARVYGLDDANALVTFDMTSPGQLAATHGLTGLASGEAMVAIDFRPSTRELVGVSNANRIYRIDPATGASTAIGIAFTPTPNGSRVAAEIDPIADQLRVVSDGDTNLAIEVTTGFTLDVGSNVAFVAGDANFGLDPAIVSLAYSQNFVGAHGSTLFGIDSAHDVLVSIGAVNTPASGELVTIGALGFDVANLVGFDVSSDGTALVASGTITNSTLYRIDLTTGALTPLGTIGGRPLRDLAIAPLGD